MTDSPSSYVRFDRLKEVDSISSALKGKDPAAVERAICFLEEDPWFLFSGYAKEHIIARLKQASFSQSQKVRVVSLILRGVDEVKRREFKQYSRLAGVLQSPEIRQAMESRLGAPHPIIARRAKQVLEVMNSRQ